MVKGLDIFKTHFREYTDYYILIGGVASSLAMEALGGNFRATKDMDIVLCIEALDEKFTNAFWDFIKKGRYSNRQRSTGKFIFYRFHSPENKSFPEMLELFSRKPDIINLDDTIRLTPIPIEEDASSLSAILLNDEYYNFIQKQKLVVEGLSIASTASLILLKASAFCDLKKRKNAGEHVDSKAIKKHKNDIFRLYTVLEPNQILRLTPTIKEELRQCLSQLRVEPIDLESIGIKNVTVDSILNELESIFELNE